MSVLQNFPFVPQNAEQAKAVSDRRDAQSQLLKDGKSNRFIAVRLTDLYAPDWRESLGPMRVINVLHHRIGVGGNKVQIEVQIRDGREYFDWDSQMGQHVAWIYDDDQGYNRSLLASHFFENKFEIMDTDIKAEVEKAAIKMRDEAANAVPTEEEKPLTESQIKDMSVESIEEQIKFLQNRKKAVLENKENNAPDNKPGDPPKAPKRKQKKSSLIAS